MRTPRSHELRSEWVISVRGEVVRRSDGDGQPRHADGRGRGPCRRLSRCSRSAETPPFPLDEDTPVDEALRLRYRYLDLRREPMQRSLELRHDVTRAIRDFLNAAGFLDLETPILTRSTPEGARDFVVPSRMQRGSFYALPQSPQLFKQLLMISGFERYYQIARCFRDEELRADRQLEFTQLDMEMAFVEEEDVIERHRGRRHGGLRGRRRRSSRRRFRACRTTTRSRGSAPTGPTCGSGSRSATSATRWARRSSRSSAACWSGAASVRGINAGAHELSRAELDKLIEFAQGQGAGGLVWAYVEEGGGWRSPVAKFLSDAERAAMAAALEASPGDLLLLVADDAGVAAQALGALRLELAERFGLVRAGRVAPAVGDRLPAGRVERRGGTLGRAPPSVHVADGGVARPARVDPGSGARAGLRRGPERDGAGRRQHPDQPPRRPVPRARDARHRP